MSNNLRRGKVIRTFQAKVLLMLLLIGFVIAISAENSADNRPKVDLEKLGKDNFIVGVSQVGVRENSATTTCAKELEIFLESVSERQVWALKLIDAFGNVPKSFTWGNYFWFSSRDVCEDLNDPLRIHLSSRFPRTNDPNIMNQTSPYPMQLRIVFFNFTSPMYVDFKLQFEPVIHVGLCFPKSCEQDEIAKYAKYYFGNKSYELQNLLDIEMTEVGVKVPGYRWSFFLSPTVLLFLGSLATVGTFCVLAEIIHRLHERCPNQKKTRKSENSTSLESFLQCFSVRENVPRILTPENSEKFLPVIAGLRTIVCLWVTLFHIYYYSLYTLRNVTFVFAKLEGITLQPVFQSCFYVDVFFVISGFLLVYNFFSNASCMQTIKSNGIFSNIKLFLKFVFYRYLRLMPVFYTTMVLSSVMFDFLDTYSPFYMDKDNGLYCKETWWYNALFINNFLDLRFICSSWSWYLGCEMQFFIFFLILLFVYAKNENFGKLLFIVSAVAFVVIGFCCNYYYQAKFKVDVVYDTIEHLYVKPWVRINPYFGGAFMGWLYYKTKGTGISLSTFATRLFWIITTIVYFTTISMTYWKETPTVVVSLVMSLGKMLFGLLVGAVIFLCQHGYGGKFNSVMGSKLFLYLNKFSFCVYMLAPVLVATIFGIRTDSTLFDEVGSGMFFIAIITITFPVSFLTILLMELPFQRVSNRFILSRS